MLISTAETSQWQKKFNAMSIKWQNNLDQFSGSRGGKQLCVFGMISVMNWRKQNWCVDWDNFSLVFFYSDNFLMLRIAGEGLVINTCFSHNISLQSQQPQLARADEKLPNLGWGIRKGWVNWKRSHLLYQIPWWNNEPLVPSQNFGNIAPADSVSKHWLWKPVWTRQETIKKRKRIQKVVRKRLKNTSFCLWSKVGKCRNWPFWSEKKNSQEDARRKIHKRSIRNACRARSNQDTT